jgi:hypothetical protein
MALPPKARGVLDNNDSVKTDGLSGLATVEYRLLVPMRRSGVILGNKGGVSGSVGGLAGGPGCNGQQGRGWLRGFGLAGRRACWACDGGVQAAGPVRRSGVILGNKGGVSGWWAGG